MVSNNVISYDDVKDFILRLPDDVKIRNMTNILDIDTNIAAAAYSTVSKNIIRGFLSKNDDNLRLAIPIIISRDKDMMFLIQLSNKSNYANSVILKYYYIFTKGDDWLKDISNAIPSLPDEDYILLLAEIVENYPNAIR